MDASDWSKGGKKKMSDWDWVLFAGGGDAEKVRYDESVIRPEVRWIGGESGITNGEDPCSSMPVDHA